MADKIRVNKKTGKTQYRVRYLWKDADGKRKDSMTGWFDSLKDAQNSAEILKYRKEELARQEKNLRAVTQIKTAFTRYVEDLGKKASAETMDNTTSDVSRFQRARTVLRYYLPNSIAYQSTRDITATTFRTWMEYINKAKGPKEKELSGNTVRQYRETLSGFNNYLANNGYYIDNELDILIDNTLTRMNIKPRRAGKRTRYCFTIGEMYVVFSNYTSVGLGDFQEFYWYTLFMVLFFSGIS